LQQEAELFENGNLEALFEELDGFYYHSTACTGEDLSDEERLVL
jgi:hypothetical protein